MEISSNDSSECAIPITAYHIWVSEVMLQQTKVETVIKYYLKWMDHFPTIHKLANATLDEVNAVWAELGYYRRAKFLHEAASMIIDQFDGKLPKTLREPKSINGQLTKHGICSNEKTSTIQSKKCTQSRPSK